MSCSAELPDATIYAAAVVTVSDSCARKERADLSGPAIIEALQKFHYKVLAHDVVPDEPIQIQDVLIRLAEKSQLVVTTGGTGIALRDVTPEATLAVCDRVLDGVAELMRREGMKKTPYAVLSRGVCGVRGKAVILNVPGNPRGAIESLEAVLGILPHAIGLLNGRTEHEQE
jgi:molybdopterin adenylyltransferase